MVPSGPDVAHTMGVASVLGPGDLRKVAMDAGGKTIPMTDEQIRSCYLWYYLLAEAFHDSKARLSAKPVRASSPRLSSVWSTLTLCRIATCFRAGRRPYRG